MKDWLTPFRSLVKEHTGTVAHFVAIMSPPTADGGDEQILDIFREFGERYVRLLKRRRTLEPFDGKLLLFRIAWESIREAVSRGNAAQGYGRDTRALVDSERNLLVQFKTGREKEATYGLDTTAMRSRLCRVDIDFRAAIVLRDILKMDDEEVAQILRLRWGVYRHRLHRGRLDFMEALVGA